MFSGAKPNEKNADFLTPLHVAAQKGNLEVVEALIRQCPSSSGAAAAACATNVNALDADGKTALHHAARNGHLSICQQLLSHGADRSIASRSGHTALQLAPEPIQRLLATDTGGGLLQPAAASLNGQQSPAPGLAIPGGKNAPTAR